MRVLLVESNIKAAANLTAYLTSEGARVEATETGEEALRLVCHNDFDIMVLSLALPDMDGSTVIGRMRTAGRDTPVLALCGVPNSQPRVKALAAGADDAVAWPLDRAELLARMRAIVRRSRGYSQPTLQVGTLTLDLERHEVTVAGIDVHLTRKEFAILQLLTLRKEMVLTKKAILSHLYGGIDAPEPKIVDVFICKIRSKLAKAGALDVIGTVWGRGYTVRGVTRDHDTPVAPRAPAPIPSRSLIMAG